METVFTVVAVALGIAAIVKFFRPAVPLVEKILTIIHVVFLVLLVLCFVLMSEGFRFTGVYSNAAIGLVFVCSGILLHGIATSPALKFYTALIAWPALITEVAYIISAFFSGTLVLMIPAFILQHMFSPPVFSKKINERYRLEEPEGFIKSPINNFELQRKVNVIFEKKIRLAAPRRLGYPIENPSVTAFEEGKYIVLTFRNKDSVNTMSSDTLWWSNYEPARSIEEVRRE